MYEKDDLYLGMFLFPTVLLCMLYNF